MKEKQFVFHGSTTGSIYSFPISVVKRLEQYGIHSKVLINTNLKNEICYLAIESFEELTQQLNKLKKYGYQKKKNFRIGKET